MFDQFDFNPEPDEEGLYHLICPKCKVEDPCGITPEVLSLLNWRGADTVCVDCDPSTEFVRYWPNTVLLGGAIC